MISKCKKISETIQHKELRIPKHFWYLMMKSTSRQYHGYVVSPLWFVLKLGTAVLISVNTTRKSHQTIWELPPRLKMKKKKKHARLLLFSVLSVRTREEKLRNDIIGYWKKLEYDRWFKFGWRLYIPTKRLEPFSYYPLTRLWKTLLETHHAH